MHMLKIIDFNKTEIIFENLIACLIHRKVGLPIFNNNIMEGTYTILSVNLFVLLGVSNHKSNVSCIYS